MTGTTTGASGDGVVRAPDGPSLFLPAAYDVLWGALALALPVGALVALYLVVRLATRHAVSRRNDAGNLVGVVGVAAVARRHAGVVAAAAWVLAAVVPQVALVVVAPLLFAAGLSVPGASSPPPSAAVLVGLAPALPGLTFLLVHAVGERMWPRADGAVRRASLAPRPVGSITPRWLRRLTVGWTAALAVALAVGAVVAEGGQRLVVAVGTTVTTTSPFPGTFYGVPLAVGVTLVLGMTAVVLRRVARRPATVEPAFDDALRLLTGHRVLRGVQLVVGWTLAGVLGVAAVALADVGLPGPGGGVGALAVVVGLGAVGAAVVPGRPAVLSADDGAPAGVARLHRAAR